jgi:hypothetical protein
MSPQDLETLKVQIKAELIAEMQKEPSRRMRTVWDDIKFMVENRTSHLRGPEQNQVLMAVSTILRYSIGLRQVKYIPFSREEEVKSFVSKLLDQMDELKINKNSA